MHWKLSSQIRIHSTIIFNWNGNFHSPMCIIGNRVLWAKDWKKNISLNKTFRILILCDFDSAEYSPHIAMDDGFQKYSHSENVVSDDIKWNPLAKSLIKQWKISSISKCLYYLASTATALGKKPATKCK